MFKLIWDSPLFKVVIAPWLSISYWPVPTLKVLADVIVKFVNVAFACVRIPSPFVEVNVPEFSKLPTVCPSSTYTAVVSASLMVPLFVKVVTSPKEIPCPPPALIVPWFVSVPKVPPLIAKWVAADIVPVLVKLVILVKLASVFWL